VDRRQMKAEIARLLRHMLGQPEPSEDFAVAEA